MVALEVGRQTAVKGFAPGSTALRFELLHGLVEHGQRPLTLKSHLRRLLRSRLTSEPFLALRPIQRQPFLTPATCLRGGRPALAQHRVPERFKQKRSEPASAGVGPGDETAFDQLREEGLGEILRLGWRMAGSTRECVERIPIGAAELFQGLAGGAGASLTRGQNHAPVRGRKRGAATAAFVNSGITRGWEAGSHAADAA